MDTTPPASIIRREYPTGQSQSETLPHRLVSVGETTSPASLRRRDYSTGGLGLGQSAPTSSPLHFIPSTARARADCQLGHKAGHLTFCAPRIPCFQPSVTLNIDYAERRTLSDEKVLYKGSSGRAQTTRQLFGQLEHWA